MKHFLQIAAFLLLPLLLRAEYSPPSFESVSLDSLKEPTRRLTKKERKELERELERSAGRGSSVARQADKLFRNLGYAGSIEYYEQLDAMELNELTMNRLATSYRLNGNFEEAEYWYGRFATDSADPDAVFAYAQMLLSNGKCDRAAAQFQRYYGMTYDESRSFIMDCDDLTRIPDRSQSVRVTNLAALNTEFLDFSPVVWNGRLSFTSNRPTGDNTRRTDRWTNAGFTDLFYTELGPNGPRGDVEPMPETINERFHDGVATFAPGGREMIFSRSNHSGANSEDIRDLKLYRSRYVGGAWQEPEELTDLNDPEYATTHPALSADGRRLYFASNRLGGRGGMDIWSSERIGNHWTEPVNLGPNVNTSGQEIFPFIDVEGRVFFASDGHRGLGGKDIYRVEKLDPRDESSYANRTNLGRPINSERDDFGFFLKADGESGYLSSNRLGGAGGDDLYEWTGNMEAATPLKPTLLTLQTCVAGTGQPLAEVELSIVETVGEGGILSGNGNLLLTLEPLDAESRRFVLSVSQKNRDVVDRSFTYTTDALGRAQHDIDPERNYILIGAREGYAETRRSIRGSELLRSTDFCLPLEARDCQLLTGRVENAEFSATIPKASVFLFDKCSGEVTETETDAAGNFQFCLPPNCDFEILARKPHMTEQRTSISTRTTAPGQPLDTRLALRAGSFDLDRRPDSELSFATPTAPITSGGPLTPELLNRYFLGSDRPDYRPGQRIKLSNIYYDYNRSEIRPDAARELDYVAALLLAYPGLEILMTSHTDSRGTDSYNAELSQQRADAAVAYLRRAGVPGHRLEGLGFGENRLVNDCENGVTCPEAAHQMNRRTEIQVVRFED